MMETDSKKEKHMKKELPPVKWAKFQWQREVLNIVFTICGSLLFAAGVNLFIVPLGVYNGGMLGISQIIRTLLNEYLHLSFGKTDIAGIINLGLNIPLFFLAYRRIGKPFFYKTIIAVVAQTVSLTFIASPSDPIVQEKLTACILGAMIAGLGIGINLRAGSSGGGMDILGLYMIKRKPGFSVGRLAIMVNACIYFICAILFNLEVVIYSVIYSVVQSAVMDKVHYQNINMSVTIFTKRPGMANAIMEELHRGVTTWDGLGAYTNEVTHVLVTVVSKYEIIRLKRIVHDIDPHAFMILSEGSRVTGNFEKRL